MSFDPTNALRRSAGASRPMSVLALRSKRATGDETMFDKQITVGRLLPAAAAVLAAFAARTSAADALTISPGTASLTGRVAITAPVRVTCSPFDPRPRSTPRASTYRSAKPPAKPQPTEPASRAASRRRYCSRATEVRAPFRSPFTPTRQVHHSTGGKPYSQRQHRPAPPRRASPGAPRASPPRVPSSRPAPVPSR